MIKKITKKKVKEVVSATDSVPVLSETTGTDTVCTDCKVDKLHVTFPNEDLNKLVEKINEIIEKL